MLARHGRLDVLVNNAGITRDQLMLRMKREDWDQVITTNLTAAFLCCQAALKPMLKQRGGRIISISSVVGQTGNAGEGELRGVQGGLIRVQQSPARRSRRGHHRQRGRAGTHRDRRRRRRCQRKAQETWEALVPVGRLGTPADVAAAVCFLASDEASYITGQVLAVNGGMYM